MIHIKGRQQTGKEASECARNNNCASVHVVFPLRLQHRTLHISSANSSGQGPGPPPHLAVQEIISICTKNINWTNGHVCFNMQEVIYPWYICCWFTDCTATSQAQTPASDPCPPSPSSKLAGCIREEKDTTWEKRGHCFGFYFFISQDHPHINIQPQTHTKCTCNSADHDYLSWLAFALLLPQKAPFLGWLLTSSTCHAPQLAMATCNSQFFQPHLCSKSCVQPREPLN